MNDTAFYVLGITLVLVALGLSALGLREEKFPASKGLLAAIAVAVAALVVATASFAWLNAEDEQEHKAAELAAEREANLAEGNLAEAGEEGANLSGEEQTTTTEEQATTTEETTTTTPALDGAQVFTDAGCAACHTLAAAGSTATTGPDLDDALKDQSPEFIETSIVDPNAVIAKGFAPDVMPQTFADQLTPEELAALVEYLSTNAGKG